MKTSRIAFALILAIVLVLLLFTVVFPLVDRMFVTNPVLGGA